MKKLILVVLLIMLSAQMCFAAGSCTQRTSAYVNGATVIQLACTGDASDGQITVAVANQATASANYTIELVFVR